MNDQDLMEEDYLLLVRETQVEIDPLVERARFDPEFRDLVVQQLVSHKHINVYFHSYRIMQQVTAADSVGCLRYWDDFVGLLQHPNSYHRNYGMDLLPDLLPMDLRKRFDVAFRIITSNCMMRKSPRESIASAIRSGSSDIARI